jgi:glutathione S-transferase
MGVAERLTLVRATVSPFASDDALFPFNPLNKIPTLVCDDGTTLYDSRVICEYLDGLHNVDCLFPSGSARMVALRNQALGDGLLDILMTRLIERLRPGEKQSPELIATSIRKTSATLDMLEREARNLLVRRIDIGHIAIGAALGYLDFRFDADRWREDRPHLTEWYAEFNSRPSSKAFPVPTDT